MQTALRFPSFLEPHFTPRTVFMDIGSAPEGKISALALQAAGYVERVYAVDVSGRFLQGVLAPLNLRLVPCDGLRIPVPEAAVDLAFSGGFIDQLHADDAREHLAAVHRSLAPGGQYVCRTSSPADLRRRMLAAGFSRARVHWPFVPLIRGSLLRVTGIR